MGSTTSSSAAATRARSSKDFFANYFVHVSDVQFDLRTQTMTRLQFCSPGFDLPVGALSRTPADKFAGYHSSADDLDLVRPESLADSFSTLP